MNEIYNEMLDKINVININLSELEIMHDVIKKTSYLDKSS